MRLLRSSERRKSLRLASTCACVTLLLRNHSRVDIHRRPAICVSQEFLCHLYIHPMARRFVASECLKLCHPIPFRNHMEAEGVGVGGPRRISPALLVFLRLTLSDRGYLAKGVVEDSAGRVRASGSGVIASRAWPVCGIGVRDVIARRASYRRRSFWRSNSSDGSVGPNF